MTYLLVFGLALSTTLLLVPLADWLGRRFGITSKFEGRHANEADARRVSKLGGIALYGGFVVAVLAAQLLPVPRLDPYEVIRLIGLLAGGTVVFIFGLLDDIFELAPLPQFLGQFLGAGIAILFQIFIEYFNNPFTGEQTPHWSFVVTVAITFLWLVGMMNTMNWLDGADGLAGGVTLIAGATLFMNSAFRVEPAQTSVSLLHLALMGAALGFVLYNFYPARIFMGGGATFLGYTLGRIGDHRRREDGDHSASDGVAAAGQHVAGRQPPARGAQSIHGRPGTPAFPADRSRRQPAPDRARLLRLLRLLRRAHADHGQSSCSSSSPSA